MPTWYSKAQADTLLAGKDASGAAAAAQAAATAAAATDATTKVNAATTASALDAATATNVASGAQTSAALRAAYTRPAALFNGPVRNNNVYGARFGGYVIGWDPTIGRYLFVTSTNFFDSNDFTGATSSSGRSLPAGASWQYFKKAIPFQGSLYMVGIIGNLITVWKTTPDYANLTTQYTWTQVFQASAGANDIQPPCFNTDGTYLYLGEYGDPTGGPSIWRTADGATWNRVLGPLSGNRHCHAVAADPYNPGHVWATFGDNGSDFVRRSTDYGSTWTTVVTKSSVPPNVWAQALQISFDPNWVWFASDQPNMTAYVMDRATQTIRAATTNYHATDIIPPGASPRNGSSRFTDGVFTSGSTTLTSATAAFTSDDVGRGITSTALPNRDTYISSVTNGTTVVLSESAASSSTANFKIGLDRFPAVSMFGAVDPSTGIFYFASHDPNNPETSRTGIFYVPYAGGRAELMRSPSPVIGMLYNWQMFVMNGYIGWGRFILPILTRP